MQKSFSAVFATVIFLLATLLSTNAAAQLLYTEGKDYTVLENPIPLQKSGQKEVVEFFSYTCPHCYNLEPHIIKWAAESKPENVGFYQIPATGGKLWTFTAKVKYVAEKLNLGHEFDSKYFAALHKDKNRRLMGSKDDVIEFMVKEGGADKTAAEKAWDSLHVKSGLNKSEKLWQQAKLSGVPVIIVNGKYVVALRDYESFFNIINYLLSSTEV